MTDPPSSIAWSSSNSRQLGRVLQFRHSRPTIGRKRPNSRDGLHHHPTSTDCVRGWQQRPIHGKVDGVGEAPSRSDHRQDAEGRCAFKYERPCCVSSKCKPCELLETPTA